MSSLPGGPTINVPKEIEDELAALRFCSVCHRSIEPTEELCPDGACKACHVSVSWEDCCSGRWFVRQLQKTQSNDFIWSILSDEEREACKDLFGEDYGRYLRFANKQRREQ